MAPTAFVAMPIKAEGSPEHAHFLAIYQQGLKPVLESLGYAVTRADEVQRSGAITRDVVLWLANADLVVVDLTDLNPNVYYELGVRHSLRKSGTVLILDDNRTQDIPFDLSAYRVIQFQGDLTGIGVLTRRLQTYVRELQNVDEGHRDNPVHDWLPSLPPNALASSRGSVEGDLRERIAKQETIIRRYERTYGTERSAGADPAASPLSIVISGLEEASQGNLPMELVERAAQAARDRDSKNYLVALRLLIERRARLSVDHCLLLCNCSENLGLTQVTGAIFSHAAELHPNDRNLRRAQLAHMAHSDDPSLKAQARKAIFAELDLDTTDAGVKATRTLRGDETSLLGVMLDAYHTDALDTQALEVTTALLESNGERSVVLRNHGRALGRLGRDDEALLYFQRSIYAHDFDDTSAVWLGNEFHNRNRHVDAVEAYLLACLMDPNDGGHFSHLADEFVWISQQTQPRRGQQLLRSLPSTIDPLQAAAQACSSALSCSLLVPSTIERCRRAADRGELAFEQVVEQRTTRSERVSFAESLYRQLRSGITSEEMVVGSTN